jgi:hypothetical protein
MSDFHSPAYYLAGKTALAFKQLGELADLSVKNPEDVLADVSREIEIAYSEFPKAITSQQQRDACMAVLVGAMAQRQGAALSAEWNAVTTPLFQLLMAAHRMNRESRQFVIDDWDQTAGARVGEREKVVSVAGALVTRLGAATARCLIRICPEGFFPVVSGCIVVNEMQPVAFRATSFKPIQGCKHPHLFQFGVTGTISSLRQLSCAACGTV